MVKLRDDPGFSIAGSVPAVMENPVPAIESELTVTAEEPVELRVSESSSGDPSDTLPKLRLVALSARMGFATAAPVPVTGTTAVAPVVELLLMVNVPVTAPAVVGAKLTDRVSDCPGARVAGSPVVGREKPVPVMEAELTVTAEVPVELNVSVSDFEDPSATLPKGRVFALSANVGSAGTVPVPLSVTTEELPVVELLLMVNVPVTAPAVAGANLTDSVSVCPGDRVAANPVVGRENPVPVMEAELTVTAEVPVELNVRVSDFEDPSVTLPKGRAVVLSANVGPAAAVPVPLSVTTEELPVVELLLRVNVPVTAPAVAGAKLTDRVSFCPGDKVAGSPVV